MYNWYEALSLSLCVCVCMCVSNFYGWYLNYYESNFDEILWKCWIIGLIDCSKISWTDSISDDVIIIFFILLLCKGAEFYSIRKSTYFSSSVTDSVIHSLHMSNPESST